MRASVGGTVVGYVARDVASQLSPPTAADARARPLSRVSYEAGCDVSPPQRGHLTRPAPEPRAYSRGQRSGAVAPIPTEGAQGTIQGILRAARAGHTTTRLGCHAGSY
jgi:hypothetical protein